MKAVAKLFTAAGAAALLAVATNASAQDVATVVVSGDGTTAGTQLVVRVEVQNNTGDAPQSGSVRLRWHGSLNPAGEQAYTIVEDPNPLVDPGTVLIVDGDLGTTIASTADEEDTSAAAGAPRTFRDFVTVGSSTFPATIQNPVVFTVTFDVTVDASTIDPQIIVEADPDATNPFPKFTLVPPSIGSVAVNSYNSSATSFTSVSEWMLLDN